MPDSTPRNTHNTAPADDEIDLGRLFGLLLDHKGTIIAITALFALVGVAYALLATPIYRADALVQVEEQGGSMMGEELAGLLGDQSPQSSAHMEILRSRMVLGQAVDQADLDVRVQPVGLPVLGNAMARYGIERPEFAEGWPSVWAGERLEVASLSVSPERLGEPLILRALGDQRFELLDEEGERLAEGRVGESLNLDGDWIELLVSDLVAPEGAEFGLTKVARIVATRQLQGRFSVSERGKDTGVLEVSITGSDSREIERTLDAINQIYLTQNIARQAAEAEKSLAFLEEQVPMVREQLNEAEDRLNAYRATQESVNLSFETQNALDSLVELESQLNELELTETELSRRFTPNHPRYQALLEQKAQLQRERQRLDSRIDDLPETQQQILRLTREVEVTQQIYVQLLNRMQELNVAKAGTVGNVRILDSAVVPPEPVEPKKPLIVVLATLLGGMLSVGLVLGRGLLNRGVESSQQIEDAGLPVYATVPLSEAQDKLIRRVKRGRGKHGHAIMIGILAEREPTDTSVEAIRSLRTSLHFAMLEAGDNRLMITGPSPGIGKSFISVNLGAVCAQAGQRVLVVDADMRKGHVHHAFKGPSEGGLSDALSGRATLNEVARESGIPGLSYVARGTAPPNPSELLMNSRFSDFLEQASQAYDLVIIDTPPVLAVTDAAIVGKQCGTSLMVMRFQANPLRELEIARRRLETGGVEIKGAILNGMERKAAAYYGYGYYNYSYK